MGIDLDQNTQDKPKTSICKIIKMTTYKH